MNNFEKNKNFCEENQDTNNTAISKAQAKKSSVKRKKKRVGFFGFFRRLADAFARGLRNGFLGLLFADLYTKLNLKWREGSVYQIFHRQKNKIRSKARLANLYESSITRLMVSWLGRFLIRTHMRTFGVAIFAFGFSSIFMAILKYSLEEVNIQPTVVTSIIIALCSLPLTVSKKRVGEALLSGKLSGFIIHQILSMDESKLEVEESAPTGSYLVAFEIAMFLGFTTYFIDPLVIVGIVLFIIAFAVIMCFPELGIMSVMILLPFINVIENPSLALLFLLIITMLAFLSKFIRGKRIMRFELIDICVLAFGILLLVGGLITQGGNSSLFSALMYVGLLCIYFLIINSYIGKTWIYRSIKLMIATTAIASLIGIINGGIMNVSWVDTSRFVTIGARVTAFLDNPNMLGAYLVIVLPFALAQMQSPEKKITKAFYFLCAIAITACLILTWSRGAWLGAIISLVVFLLVSNFRNIWAVIIGVASMPALALVLPYEFVDRFISIFSMKDSTVIYRFDTWKGTLGMIGDYFWTGIGVGESAFMQIYPKYALSGTETVMHSHNLFLQIMLELGILGLLVFLIIIFMFTQKCFVGIKESRRGSKSRLMTSAGLASVCGTLVMGLTDHAFYNYRVFLVFWTFVALTVALTKINEKEKYHADEARRVNSDARSANLDIFITN